MYVCRGSDADRDFIASQWLVLPLKLTILWRELDYSAVVNTMNMKKNTRVWLLVCLCTGVLTDFCSSVYTVEEQQTVAEHLDDGEIVTPTT